MCLAAGPSGERPLPKPPLYEPVALPTGAALRRVGGDPGESLCFPGRPCPDPSLRWGTRSIHHGFKDQPWSADGALVWIRNGGQGSFPKALALDAATWRPALFCSQDGKGSPAGDDRWHPDPRHARVRVEVTGAAPRRLRWIDVTDCLVVRDVPIPAEGGFDPKGIGDGEGNLSDDGRYVFLHDPARVSGRLVDMEPAGPCPAGAVSKGGMCFGPVTPLDCGLPAPAACRIGHSTVTPTGRRVVVKHTVKGAGRQDDYLRVYEVDRPSLSIKPASYAIDPACRPHPSLPRERGRDGWVFRLAHADVALNPFDAGKEYLVGARRPACGEGMNRVVMVDLSSGEATAVSTGDPRTEEAPHHVSARAVRRPGWVVVTYRHDTPCKGLEGCRFRDAIAAFRMQGGDGRREERYGIARSDHDALPGDDDDEAQAVPSPDGRAILFRSTWSLPGSCPAGACGWPGQVNAYVIERSKQEPVTPPDR